MKKAFLAVAMLWSTAASAQPLVDGTTPGASTVVERNVGDATWQNQSFTAIGSSLSSFSVWFYGGTHADFPVTNSFARLQLWTGNSLLTRTLLFDEYLDQSHQGRLDVVFDAPLSVNIGEWYTISLFSDGCGAVFLNDYCGPNGLVPGDAYRMPGVEVTTEDAYEGGYYWISPNAVKSYDMRFEVTYVPEPTVVWLLVIAVAGIALRRRVTL